MESSLNSMLAATLGPNKATVKVNADLNVDDTTEKEMTYAAKGTPLKQTQETEELEGGAAATGGTAGTGANVPTYSAGAAAGGMQLELQPQEDRDRLRRQQEDHRDQDRPRARSTSSTSR